MRTNNWPNDADGDVFRRLASKGFDFSKDHIIDFNIDFESWPPSEKAIGVIKNIFPHAKMFEEGDDSGYILCKVKGMLTYELVVDTQSEITLLMAEYGGRCDSWGVESTPRAS